MKLIRIVAALFALAPAGQVPAHASDAGDSPAAIRAVIHDMFDRPDAELVIDPVVVVDGFAVAGWTQGEMGGRAFLKAHHGHWALVLCSGDRITTVEALTASGVPPENAATLAAEIAAADATVDAARLAMFASFEGVVTMDEHAKH
jgi:hypothetical protein